MSIHSMAWVMNQEIFPSTAKFVLLCLSDHEGNSNVVFPSIKTLCKKTSQDRKTIISCLDRLCELGFLKEVGVKPGGVKEYMLLGFSEGETHYVYRLSHHETGDFYIGARTCEGSIESDSFFGGSRWMQEVGVSNISKETIGIYSTRKEAELAEAYFIDLHKDSKNLKNRFQPAKKEIPKSPPVPKTELVPKTVLGSPDNGMGGSPENGMGVVPKTGHRIINEPSIESPVTKFFAGINPQVAKDFLKLRKTKSADLTETAMQGFIREAKKANVSLEQALRTCCEQNWTGFRADWYFKINSNAGPKKEKFDPVAFVNRNAIKQGAPIEKPIN